MIFLRYLSIGIIFNKNVLLKFYLFRKYLFIEYFLVIGFVLDVGDSMILLKNLV